MLSASSPRVPAATTRPLPVVSIQCIRALGPA